jgi:hypothetical protein
MSASMQRKTVRNNGGDKGHANQRARFTAAERDHTMEHPDRLKDVVKSGLTMPP